MFKGWTKSSDRQSQTGSPIQGLCCTLRRCANVRGPERKISSPFLISGLIIIIINNEKIMFLQGYPCKIYLTGYWDTELACLGLEDGGIFNFSRYNMLM